MPDYLFLMRRTPEGSAASDWGPYLDQLRQGDRLRGGSSIGEGACLVKSGSPPGVTEYLTGFIRVQAADLDEAASLLAGNPVFEAGGVVEIRELTRED